MPQHILVEIMSQMTSLNDQERADIEASFPIRTFEKGTYLLREGQIAVDAFYVVKGCIRAYELHDGEERTTAFFTEDHSVANFDSMANGTPSTVNYVCEEATTVAVVNPVREQQLYDKHPRFETFCRKGMEQIIGAQQVHLINTLVTPPQDRYLQLRSD